MLFVQTFTPRQAVEYLASEVGHAGAWRNTAASTLAKAIAKTTPIDLSDLSDLSDWIAEQDFTGGETVESVAAAWLERSP